MESENDNQGNNIAAYEEQVFFNLDGTRHTNSTANQSTLADDNCTSCNEVSRTNGSLAANRVGAALLLDVMPGDELDLEVWAYNEGGISTATSRIASSTLVSALVSAFVPNGSGTDLYTQTNSIFTGVSSYLTGGGSSGSTRPFAFLNYIVFDNNFNRVTSGHQRVSSTLNAKHLLTLNNVNITQKGYVYVWVSNESNQNQNVYFDDFKVTHTKGAILQEDHYYPFGANISALSSTAPLSKPNQFKYNGKELNEEFGLDWYDYQARNYDPQLGRWFNVDPMADAMRRHSPYNYAFDNPLRFIDPDGMAPDDIILRGAQGSSITVKTDLVDLDIDASSLGVDFGGEYTFEGDDILVAALDVAGIFDPTGVADIAAGSLEMKNGNFWGGLASYAGVLPLAGDAAKLGKVPKHLRTINNAIDQLKINKVVGKEGERIVKAQLEKSLKQGETLLEQASFKLGNGKRSRPDFTVIGADGNIKKIVEAKTGNAKLTKNQLELQKNGGTLTGKKAGDFKGAESKGGLEERRVDVGGN